MSLQEQASWLKGSTATLTPIPDAARWLGSPDFEAYRDTSGAELVYDRVRGLVLSWETEYRTVTATDTYRLPRSGVPVATAVGYADVRLERDVYKGDLSTMRRRVRLFNHGNGYEFDFSYDRYVNGVRIPDFATVACSGRTGKAGNNVFTSTKPSSIGADFHPKLDLKTAVTRAAASLKLQKWRFLSAELYESPLTGRAGWLLKLQDETPLPPDVTRVGDEHRVFLDPLTGAVVGAQGTKTSGAAKS
jgi:hypothetical protein